MNPREMRIEKYNLRFEDLVEGEKYENEQGYIYIIKNGGLYLIWCEVYSEHTMRMIMSMKFKKHIDYVLWEVALEHMLVGGKAKFNDVVYYFDECGYLVYDFFGTNTMMVLTIKMITEDNWILI